jgi:GT2 family glycosyltransferase
MRKFDERYGQFGSDADLTFQIARSGKKILLVPDAQVIHRGGEESPEKRADFALGKAAFVGKYKGFAAWFGAVAAAALAALAGFRLKEFTCIVGGSKIDGRS